MTYKIVAMVPVRAGSMRVKSKNTRKFADTNLLELKLKVLNHVNGFDRIVVTTDCQQSAEIAQQYGATVQWRSEFYAGSTVTNDQHWRHIAETTPGDVVFLAQTTSPLVRAASMQNAIKIYKENVGVTSVNSVSSVKEFLWQNGSPINYELSRTPKSQDLPEIVSLNFAITVISRKEMIEQKNVIGRNSKFLELDKLESMDIDDYTDFEIAETVFSNRGLNWLLS